MAIASMTAMYSASVQAESYMTAIPDEESLGLNYKIYCVKGVEYLVASRREFGGQRGGKGQLVMSVMYTPKGTISTCKKAK